ncbi:MAG: acetate/propionate family kinase [Gammaproteobacteria bacterium]|nr:acetate/propionate family kinase [Gammaproteobacteria bacterium]
MQMMTVNVGSSSLRLDLFSIDPGRPPERIKRSHFEDHDASIESRLREFLTPSESAGLAGIAHRVVHGGHGHTGNATLVDAAVLETIEGFVPMAPLHNPRALAGIAAARGVFGEGCPQAAVFDTSFFRDLPDEALRYALPETVGSCRGLRRFGFHGIAHQSMWQSFCEQHPNAREKGRLITIQLGSGCSMTAVRDGKPRDTSMGFTPLEGLVMATRSGDLDPGIVTYLMRHHGFTAEALDALLSRESGLLGVSGESGDMRVLLNSNSPGAERAIDLYCHRVRKYIGAYLAVLGGADAAVFGGGVGENSPEIRARICNGLEGLGIVLDDDANRSIAGRPGGISDPDSPVKVWVFPVDEALAMARHAACLFTKRID